MKKAIPFVIALGAAVLVGCGGETEATAEPELAASLEDIVGTWDGIKGGGGFIQIEGDGAWLHAGDLDGLEDRQGVTGEIRFGEMQFIITETAVDFGAGEICVDSGIYEVQLLESGNLKFVVIDDECERRANALQGAEGIDVEYKPVP